MTSLLTNSAAMVALQTLSNINAQLDTTNNRVSTGLRIADAADSSAYWAIATTTRSDNGALGTVKDALAIGGATMDVVYNGLDSVRENLQEMKDLLVAAKQPGVDRDNIQTQITGIVTDMQNKANASVINEQNFLSVDITDSDYNASKDVVASFERAAGGSVSVSTIQLDIADVILIDAGSQTGILDVDRAGSNSNTAAIIDFDGATIDIGSLSDSATDLATLDDYIEIADAALTATIAAQNTVGVIQARVESQGEFVSALMDANDRAVGALVDANMEEESTKLRALQTQQQLAVQSLSIANSAAQNVLTLFR